MNLITALIDFQDNECGSTDTAYASDRCFIKILELEEQCGDYVIKYAYVNEKGDTTEKSYWYYDCQDVLRVEFQNGSKLDFIHDGSDSKRFKKLKGTDITIEDFFSRYIANGYEIEPEPEMPIELDDIVL